MNFSGKKGVVLGVLNKRSIAALCANHLQTLGATVMCSYLPDAEPNGRRVRLAQAAVAHPGSDLMAPYDAASDESIATFFETVRTTFGTIDFLVHAISMVPPAEPDGQISQVTRQQFRDAMDISVHSLLSASRHANKIMVPGSSIVTLSYLSSDKVVAGYELLGVCKAALEASVRYLAQEMGSSGIRVNTVSAAPFPSSAALGNPAFPRIAEVYKKVAPLQRLTTPDEIVRSIAFLLSDGASGITGERLYVDGGFNHMAAFA